MLRVAYLTHTNISISETFIYDLLIELNKDVDLDVSFISGHNEQGAKIKDLKTEFTGFSNNYDFIRYGSYKIGQVLNGSGFYFKNAINKLIAEKQLRFINSGDYDVALVDYATSGVLVRRLLKRKKIPFIVHVHGYDLTSATADPEYRKELLLLFRDAVYFVAPSEHMKRLLVLLGCEESKIRVIYRGIITEQIDPMPWSKRKKEAPGIVFLGRLTEKKHPVALLHAFRIVKEQVKNAHLSIIGDGELKEEVLSAINSLSLKNHVTMYGSLPRKEAFKILRKHWVYAQHSVTSITGDQEGFPFSLAEASAHELPVVSTIHNGIPENVIDGKTGFLVPEFNYEAMAEKIIYILNNSEIAVEMGKNGRERILSKCKPDLRVLDIKNLLFQTAEKR